MSERFEQLQQEWREKLQVSYWMLVVICFLMETLIVVLRFATNSIDTKEIVMTIFRDILFPSIFNVIISIIVSTRNNSVLDSRAKNNTFIYGALGIVVVIVTFHGMYVWTLCLFSLPIIVSVMFADKKLTRNTTIISALLMYVSIILCWLMEPSFSVGDHYIQGTLNLAFMLAVYIISSNLIDFLEQKNEIIEDYDKNESDLNHALTQDNMTKLYNHSEFNRVLELRRTECLRNKVYMSVVMADIDHFKHVNDTYGHKQGDKVLLYVAERLKHYCGSYGQVFRYGGEEFAVIMMNKSAHETKDIMEEFRIDLSQHQFDFMPDGEFITISVGIYKYAGEDTVETHEIFDRADKALYEAKETGRNQTVIFKKKD